MNSRQIACVSLALWIALPIADALAQDSSSAQQASAEARRAEEYRRAIEARQAAEEERLSRERAAQSMADFLKDGRTEIRRSVDRSQSGRDLERRQRHSRFRQAFAEFQAARQELSEALGFEAPLKKVASRLEKPTKVLLDLIRSPSRPRFDDSEFEGFTNSELGWEALTTAENLAPALALLIASDNQPVIDVGVLTAIPKIEMELLRLRWMAQHLK